MKRIRAVLKWLEDIRADITKICVGIDIIIDKGRLVDANIRAIGENSAEQLKVANDTQAICEDTNRIARLNDDRLTALEERFRDVSAESLKVDRSQLKSIGGVRLMSNTRRMLETRDAMLAQKAKEQKAAKAAEGVS